MENAEISKGGKISETSNHVYKAWHRNPSGVAAAISLGILGGVLILSFIGYQIHTKKDEDSDEPTKVLEEKMLN